VADICQKHQKDIALIIKRHYYSLHCYHVLLFNKYSINTEFLEESKTNRTEKDKKTAMMFERLSHENITTIGYFLKPGTIHAVHWSGLQQRDKK